VGLVRCGVADTPLHTLRGLESPSQFGLFWAPHLFWTPPDEAIKAGFSTPTVVQDCRLAVDSSAVQYCTHRHDRRNTTRKEMASPDNNGRPLALHTQLRPIAVVQPYCGTFVGCLRLLVVSPSATKYSPAVVYSRSPKNPTLQLSQERSKSASTTPRNRIWNTFGSVCGIFGRTAVGGEEILHQKANAENALLHHDQLHCDQTLHSVRYQHDHWSVTSSVRCAIGYVRVTSTFRSWRYTQQNFGGSRQRVYSHYSVISVPVISTVDITGTTEAPQSPRDRGM